MFLDDKCGTKCSLCNAINEKGEHVYSIFVNNEIHKCNGCNKTEKHELGEWLVDNGKHYRICSICMNETSHNSHVYDNTQMKEGHKCDICGNFEKHSYNEQPYISNDNGQHYQECKYCGFKSDLEVCAIGDNGTVASCNKQSLCGKCKNYFGEIDNTNHVNRVIKEKVEPTCSSQGYSGNIYCSDCNIILEKR